MDEFLVSGETIIRNLEHGQRRGEEFGGAMAVGYLPDMFGHVAQMPQILRQAGIDTAVVWRGVPGEIDSHSFAWEAPDGSSVRAEYLPFGYGNGAYLLDVPGQLGRGLEAVRESHREFFGDEPVLAMLGTDHMEPLPQLTTLLEESGAAAQVSTLPDYLATVDGRRSSRRWRGELRSSARANMLMGTLSARLDLKAAMARAERALTRYAEPFQALYGTAWPDRLLDLAWRRLIENSAHDSICGCSVDEVSTQVLVRCYEAEQIAMGLAEDAAREAAAEAPMGSVVVFNPSPAPRWDNVELSLGVPARWKDIALELPDGTRVAAQRLNRNEPLLYEERVASSGVPEWLRRRLHGRELFGRRLNRMTIEQPTITFEVDEEDDPIWLDLDELKNELEVATSAEDGEWDVRIVARRRSTVVARVRRRPLAGRRSSPSRAPALSRSPWRWGRTGSTTACFPLPSPPTGHFRSAASEGVGRLVDGGDEGDSYNYAPPAEDHLVEDPDDVRVSVITEGPVRGVVSIVRSYRWSPAQVPVEVETMVELRAGERFCRVRVSLENPLSDHRLRFHVPLPREARFSAAEGQFAVVERALEAEEGFGEVALPTFPAYGFVYAGGMAALLEHPMEYELVDGGREMALTILRSAPGLSAAAPTRTARAPRARRIQIRPPSAAGRGASASRSIPTTTLARGRRPRAARALPHPFVVVPGAALDGPTSATGPELRGEGASCPPAAARPAARGTGCVRASRAGAGPSSAGSRWISGRGRSNGELGR